MKTLMTTILCALLLATSALAYTSTGVHEPSVNKASLHWMSPTYEVCYVPVNAYSKTVVPGIEGKTGDGKTVCYVPRNRHRPKLNASLA